MKYLCTLLKDLPGYDAGTIFEVQVLTVFFSYVPSENAFELKKIYSRRNISKGEEKFRLWDSFNCFYVDLLDDPLWFTKELVEDSLTDSRCPQCGGTKFDFYLRLDPSLCTNRKFVMAVCPCGCEFCMVRLVEPRDDKDLEPVY